jgi:DNA-binding response OmpR family regulator
VLYVAGAADAGTLRSLYARVAPEAGVATVELPDGVEAVRLRRNGATLLMLLNHADEERVVPLESGARDLLSGGEHELSIRLAAFAVAVLSPVQAPVETA